MIPVVRQRDRRGDTLPAAAGKSSGAGSGREEPEPGPGAYPAATAHATGPVGRRTHHHPRAQAHLVPDNYVPHINPEVQECLLRQPRLCLRITPTNVSWMKQMDCRFSIVHGAAIRRGVFHNLAALLSANQQFLYPWIEHRHPFKWVKSRGQPAIYFCLAALPIIGVCARVPRHESN